MKKIILAVSVLFLAGCVGRPGTTVISQEREATDQQPSWGLQVIGARYMPNNDVIGDLMTGLSWQRCALGQTWNGSTCAGKANRYSWFEAKAAADQIPGWRLPTPEELQTLVFCSSGKPSHFKNNSSPCEGEYQRPTIMTRAFPNIVLPGSAWVASEDHSRIQVLNFYNGATESFSVFEIAVGPAPSLSVRLVRE